MARTRRQLPAHTPGSNSAGSALQRLGRRAAQRLLHFLYKQLLWAAWVGGISLAGYLIAMHTRYTWVAAGLFCVAFILACCWFMDLIHYEDDGYTERSSRRRESPLEQQQKEVQEDIDRYQREQEDRS